MDQMILALIAMEAFTCAVTGNRRGTIEKIHHFA